MSRGTSPAPRHARRRISRRTRVAGFAALGSVGLVAAGLGATGLLDSVHTEKAVRSFSAIAGSATAAASPSSGPAATASPTQQAVPASLSIPSIGLHTTLQLLGLNASGELNPPTDTTQAGWYTGSSLPGRPGPTVLAGHVDTYQGPAVFFRLDDLAPGDTVTVTLSNGRSVEYVVNEVQLYSKDDFPTAEVYGARPDPELRLITCGGTFDYTTRSYLDNVVVYATLASNA
jgi:LPXTG-site transpeptidase (sortase) family protein